MADNYVVDEGSGAKKVATDERSIGGDTVHVQRTAEVGSTSLSSGTVSADTTSGGVEVVAARETRRSVLLVNRGTVTVYVGTGSVSSSNASLLPGEALTLETTAQVKAKAASGSASVDFFDEYD